jgi:TatD DNase family protein
MSYNIIDSHCHLDFKKFNKDREEAIERANLNGVTELINSGIDYRTNESSLKLSDKYPNIHATLGLSPMVASNSEDNVVDNILFQIEQNLETAVGIGEAGMDFYHCKNESEKDDQLQAFKKVVELADSFDKTLVIHGRDAEDKILNIVQHLDNVVFHCYSGSIETMKKITGMGYYVSIATLVCFSKHHQSLVRELPLDKMLLETDSPYLSPHRGKRNEPAFIINSVDTIANILNTDASYIASKTAENTHRVFGL